MSTWVSQYEPLELFRLRTNVQQVFFSPSVEVVVIDQVFFQMFDISIRSEGIGDQSRKLSEIAPNFGRFSRFQILGYVSATMSAATEVSTETCCTLVILCIDRNLQRQT